MASSKKIFTSHSVSQTEEIAKDLASHLLPGDVVAFIGGMGMGKTQFTRGIVSFFGDGTAVSSPTFSIMNYYNTTPPIYHFDMYRITSEEDLYSTGFYDYLDMNGIVVIEWSENISEYLPDNTIYISIEASGENDRVFTIIGGDIEW